MEEYYRFTLSFILYVCMKYHSGEAWKEKFFIMFKNMRKIDLIERGSEEQFIIGHRKTLF